MKFINKVSVADFIELHKAAAWKVLSAKEIKRSLKNSNFLVSSIEDGKAVGMARIVGDNATHGLLCDVIVHPDYQHKGIGTAMVKYLMDRVQEFANKHDQYIVELLPTPGNREFYQKCGFKYLPDKMDGCYNWFKNQNIYKE